MSHNLNNPSTPIPPSACAVLKPVEFSAVFGHKRTWAYRQIYAGKVKVIADMGRIMIPRTEIERLQKEAGIYECNYQRFKSQFHNCVR